MEKFLTNKGVRFRAVTKGVREDSLGFRQETRSCQGHPQG